MEPKSADQVLAALGSQPYPTPDQSLLKHSEKAFKWTLAIDSNLNPTWSCSVVLVEIDNKPFAKGSCRTAHKLKDLSCPNQHFVAKFSTKKSLRGQYFMDVFMQTFCLKWAHLYNSFNPPKNITFLPSFVLELIDRGETPIVCGGEPFIEGEYIKFNNNSGYVNSDAGNTRNTPQAFSHFSLMHSNQELVIIDIQGVNDFYTDPQIHTKSGKGFGEGNLGKDGIYKFVKSHQCNPLCNFLKLAPLNSVRRMPLRGTLPAVQLELDMTTKSAIIKGDKIDEEDEEDESEDLGSNDYAQAQNPLLPTSPVASASPSPNLSAQDLATNWNLKSFKLYETVRGSQAECIVADEKLLYTGSTDGSLGIWNPTELKHVGNFKAGHSKAVRSLVLNKGVMYSAGGDFAIKEWDIENQKVINEVKDKGEVNSIVIQDNILYSACNDKTVKIWDTRSFKCTATLSSHTRAVKCLYVLGNYLFSGSNDQQILVWSLQTNSVLTNLQGHEGWIKSLAGTKTTLYSGSHDDTIRVWDLNSLQCKQTIKTKDKVEALLATSQALFSASGDYFEIWDINTYSLASSTNTRTSMLALARHGNRVFCGSIGNHLKVWSCE